MARMVTVSITYDMDDTEKPLVDELRDWLRGDISVQDLDLIPVPQIVSGIAQAKNLEDDSIIEICELD